MDRENIELLALASRRLRTLAGTMKHHARALETRAHLIEKNIGLTGQDKRQQRNAAIVAELARGATVKAVARRFGLTPGRVSQIRATATVS